MVEGLGEGRHEARCYRWDRQVRVTYVPSRPPVSPAAPPASGNALLRRALWRHRGRLARGYPLIVLWQLAETLVPVAIGLVIDHGIAPADPRGFVLWLGVLVATMLVLGLSYRFGSRFVVRSIETESHLLRVEIAEHVLHPRGARTDLLPGEVLSVATSDTEAVVPVMRQLGFALASLISMAVVAAYVLTLDVLLGLTILLGVPAVLAIVQLLTPAVARHAGRQQETTARTAGLATDLVKGLRALKGIGGEDVASQRYREHSTAARRATVSLAGSWGRLTGLTTGLSGLFLAVVTALAAVRALDGHLTLGQLVAIVGLTQFLAEPIRTLGEFSADFARSRASAIRIAVLLATPPLASEGTHDVPPSADLELTAAAVGPVHDLSLRTRPGDVTALVVDDPAASDALVEALLGERDLRAGHVRLGGVDLADLTIAARHAALIVSSHHAGLMEGTIRSTIDPAGRLDDATLEEVVRASAADDVIDLHPDGLDRTVRRDGSSLSGGQRQRLALARALATDAPVLVLQDPTSAVDAVTEQRIAEGLTRLRAVRGGATLVVTSSPALLAAATTVLFVREGRVVARGTHADLLDSPAYAEAVLR